MQLFGAEFESVGLEGVSEGHEHHFHRPFLPDAPGASGSLTHREHTIIRFEQVILGKSTNSRLVCTRRGWQISTFTPS